MCQAQQKWSIAIAPNSGNDPNSPYYKITIAGTDRALAATAERELATLPDLRVDPNNCGGLRNCRTALGV